MPRPKTHQPSRLSEAVAHLRHALNVTQPELAEMLGVKLLTVARWETTRPPSGEALVRLRRLSEHVWKEAMKLPDLTPEAEEFLVEMDNTFFSALASEFPIYRQSVLMDIRLCIARVMPELLNASLREDVPEDVAEAVRKSAEELTSVGKFLDVLDPIMHTLPANLEPGDVATKLVPLIVQGVSGGTASPQKVAATVREVKRRVRSKGKPK